MGVSKIGYDGSNWAEMVGDRGGQI